MPKTNSQNQDEAMKSAMEMILKADEVYDEVLDRLDLPEDDDIYRVFVRQVLERRTVEFMAEVIWENFDKKKAQHFREYLNQMAVIEPDMDHHAILIEFAMMYPDLREKIFASLPEFLDRFIEKFNALS